MLKRIRTYFLRGILILLPASATFFLCFKLFVLLDQLILKYISSLFHRLGFPSSSLLNLFVFFSFVALVGFFGGNFLGKKFIVFTNFLVNKIPYIRVIYATIQQILETIFKQKKSTFSKVALVEYPRKGLYSIGFVTADTGGNIREKIGQDCWSLFIPTTPNPTSGVLIFAPKSEVQLLDLTVDQAAKLVMSAGVIDEDLGNISEEKIHIQKIPGLMQKFKGILKG